MNGKLIVIEGSDGSGKATQSCLLYESLKASGYPVKMVSFPDYDSPSSALVKMYLNGELGENPEEQNLYAVSMFYAVDRYASFIKSWKKFYDGGGIIICDRYTTSNIVHQGAKLSNTFLKIRYYSWLMELEYEKFGLPKPDKVFFLDVPPEISTELREARRNKITNEEALDIHEKNQEYMKKSYESARFAADHLRWDRVDCVQDNLLRSRESIHQELLDKTENMLSQEKNRA